MAENNRVGRGELRGGMNPKADRRPNFCGSITIQCDLGRLKALGLRSDAGRLRCGMGVPRTAGRGRYRPEASPQGRQARCTKRWRQGRVRRQSFHTAIAAAGRAMTRPDLPRDSLAHRRCFTREEAAHYCGCETLSAFNDWVRRKIIPGPVAGTHRWDRKASDAALDQASKLSPTPYRGTVRLCEVEKPCASD